MIGKGIPQGFQRVEIFPYQGPLLPDIERGGREEAEEVGGERREESEEERNEEGSKEESQDHYHDHDASQSLQRTRSRTPTSREGTRRLSRKSFRSPSEAYRCSSSLDKVTTGIKEMEL